MSCGNCDKTDGLCYTSNPPKVRCTVTGEYRLYDDECNIKAGTKDKPIRDYTLGEAKQLCEIMGDCYGCVFENATGSRCRIYLRASLWDLSDPPRWTAEEVERAKALNLLFGLPYLHKSTDGHHITNTNREIYGASSGNDKVYSIPKDLFPTLRNGETVKLEDIIHG